MVLLQNKGGTNFLTNSIQSEGWTSWFLRSLTKQLGSAWLLFLSLHGDNMWKLVDVGSYPWFIKTERKYIHCVKANTGDYKKLSIKRYPKKYGLVTNSKADLAYLMSWPLQEATDILNINSIKFYLKHWKTKDKTLVVKEILKYIKQKGKDAKKKTS